MKIGRFVDSLQNKLASQCKSEYDPRHDMRTLYLLAFVLLIPAAHADLLSTATATVQRPWPNNCKPNQYSVGTIAAYVSIDRCVDIIPGVTDPPIIGPAGINVTTGYGYGKIFEWGSSEADGVGIAGLSEFTEFVDPGGSGAGVVRLTYDYDSCGITGFDPANPCVELGQAALAVNNGISQIVPGVGAGSLFFDVPVSDLSQPVFITSDFSYVAHNIHGPQMFPPPAGGETFTIALESVTGVPAGANPEPSAFLLLFSACVIFGLLRFYRRAF